MLRPNFEDPLDTAEDLVYNNITVFTLPWSHMSKHFFAQSPIPEYNKLAEYMHIAKNWDDFDYYAEHHVIVEGTHAVVVSYLWPKYLAMGRWWRSKERLRGSSPFVGYLSNKKWHLNEVQLVNL